MYYKSDFDLDLSTGKAGENTVQELLSLKTVEVKTDFLTVNTGNVVVEYESRGKPSGIAITKAGHWAFHIPNRCTVVVETERLKELCRTYYKKGKIAKGGDNMSSMLVLIPLSTLLYA